MQAPKHIHEVQTSHSSSASQASSTSSSTTTAPSHAKTIAEVRDNNDMPVTGQASPLPMIGLGQFVVISGIMLAVIWRKWRKGSKA